MSDIEVVVDMPVEYSGMVFGQFDEYAKEIERNLKVDLISCLLYTSPSPRD